MKQFATSVVELRQPVTGELQTHPFEAGWADEAMFFVELEAPSTTTVVCRAQLSPDGIRWVNEGSELRFEGPGQRFLRLSHFGGFLRLDCRAVADGTPAGCTITVRLALKG
jgi:hypothetical protein